MTGSRSVITALEYQQKRPDRVNVYLDGAFGFALAESVVQEAGLRRGMPLEPADIQDLLDRDGARRAYDAALVFLSYRPRSEAEIRRNLEGKRYAPERIEEALAKLRRVGLVDDAEFVRYWIENRDTFSPRGGRALRAELRAKGVGDEELRAAFAEGRDEVAGAYAAGERKARQLRGLDRRTFRERLGAYLARRGFSYEAIAPVVDRLFGEMVAEDAGGAEGAEPSDEG